MNSPVRLADLTFPQVNRLIHRTRLAFIHLDNLLAFGKRDRDGRVDGYITAYLPEECLLLFFRKGEAVNAASLHTTGRQLLTITEALKRMRGEVERGELVYAAAPMEQLAWMYQSCAAPVQSRFVDPEQPGAFFPALQQEQVSGVLELISNGRVSYLRFGNGRFTTGYFCDRPEALPVGKYIESQFAHTPDGATPAVVACLFPPAAELPAQAANALINTYRELYWRIVDEVDKEFPGEAKRRAQKVSAGLVDAHRAITILSAPRGTDTPDSVVQPEELSNALTDWSLQLLEGVEVISFHAHSNAAALRRILHLLASGKDVALVTDAGTPTVSDPGAVLVAAARERDIPVITVPGPTAVAAALSVSGLGADRYLFLGFVPRKGAERRRLLELVARSEWTVVLFEAPPRVAELLADLAAACGAERPAAVARELTKLFEETRAGTLAELAGYYAEAPARGEGTVMVAGTRKPTPGGRATVPPPQERAPALFAQGVARRDVAQQVPAEV